jgi:hypothetical protein
MQLGNRCAPVPAVENMPIQTKTLARAMVKVPAGVRPAEGVKKKRHDPARTGRNYRCDRPRAGVLASIVFVAIPMAVVGADPDEEVSKSQPAKRESYLHHVFSGPGPELKSAAGAGITQSKGTPYEWGGGAAGYARRFGSAFGKHIVKSSIQYSIARLRHEELGYRPSGKEGVGPRLRYALVSTVITRKTTTGKRTVSTSEIAGVLGGGLISRWWQPASLHTVASGFGSAGISLGADASYNVVREFWPEIRHPRRRKQKNATALATPDLTGARPGLHHPTVVCRSSPAECRPGE